MTFECALKAVPACLVGALDRPKSLYDLQLAAEHEIAMYIEQQDGCLTAKEIKQVREFLSSL